MSVFTILASNIRKKRGNLSQEAFANKVKVSSSTIGRLENEDQNITLKTLDIVAKSLKCHICDLLKK